MGQWETERGHGGDTMADYLGAAFEKIGQLVAPHPQYRMIDLADAIEFCSRGILRVEIHPAAKSRDMKVCDLNSEDCETIPNRGQIAGMNERKRGRKASKESA